MPAKNVAPTRPKQLHEPKHQFIRANQIARSPGNQEPLIDISVSTWWRWAASGRAPKPIRLSSGTTVWDLSEVLDFIQMQAKS